MRRKRKPSSATRPTLRRGCRRSPSRAPSLSPTARNGWSPVCSTTIDLGERELKGFAAPVRVLAHRRRDGGRESLRGAARRADAAGRAAGGARLPARTVASRNIGTGPGRAAVGEAGIGKSRLIAALAEQVARRAACASCAISARPTTPTARSIPSSRSWSGRRDSMGDDNADTRARQARGAAWRDRSQRRARRFRCWRRCCRSMQAGDTSRRSCRPRRSGRARSAALTRLVEAPAANAPVLVLVEDAHWIDPTTGRMAGYAD